MGWLDPPQNTGVPTAVDRFFGILCTKLGQLIDRVRAVDEAQVAVVAGNFAMTSENVVEYVGTGGNIITIPPADAISGRRARPRYVVNNGSAAVTLAATGQRSDGTAHTINGAATASIDAGAMVVLLADGDATTRWVGGVKPGLFRSLNGLGLVAIMGGATGGGSGVGSLVISTIQSLLTMPADDNTGQIPFLFRQGFVSRLQCVGSSGATAAVMKVGQGGGGANNCDLAVFGNLTASGSPINFNHARTATPVTLADVIAVLQAFGLSS